MAARWFHVAFLFILCSALPLFASGPTGTITGTITDPSGAVIPKARIIVHNEGTNATREATSNSDGDYTVALLPPGRYRVAVEGPGFRRSVIHGVVPRRRPDGAPRFRPRCGCRHRGGHRHRHASHCAN